MLARRANMKSITRVVVYLSKENSCPQRARFQQSIVGHFCTGDEDSWMVNCALDQRRFLISDREFAGSNRVLLQKGKDKKRNLLPQRPPFCPIKHLTEAQASSLPVETQERGVDVGVAILLQSANQKVLLTRRSKTLSSFPNIWVPPGGHIEQDEQLLDAGLRELGEETGLWLEDGEFSWRPLALWEVRLKPNEAEVSAYAWLDEPVLASIAATQNEIGATSAMAGDLPPAVSITEVQHGSAKTLAIPTTMFLSSVPLQGEDVERVSTGTKFALRLWLDTLAVQAE
ncbi:nucleoside diphosphate-linked moiety X motif 17 isoform X3 [Podarcis raffonei]|uniref:nucleoside diphosphate-linked moiety X motif 17 isoform X3 n=1 Tax=Podarcis raffonei TaxID=65483 RepID=UPI0023299988|nr:nucleoside diphosphate-linked moiety X motif 17 isoform X3 [Podarcis raffonei]